MSSQFENDLAKRIHRQSRDEIRAYRCGYSGSNAMPQPDVLVTTETVNYAVELKGPIASERHYVEEDDLQQLVECGNGHTIPVLAVRFQNRELMVVRYFESIGGSSELADGWDDLSVTAQFARLAPDSFDPNVTDSGSLSLTKASTDDWPSATAGSDDVDALLSGMGVPTEDSTVVDP